MGNPVGRSPADPFRCRVCDERRWELIEEALDAIPDEGHDWDRDPAAWVRAQRAGDARRVG